MYEGKITEEKKLIG